MALKKEDIQYIIDTLTFYTENTELKNDRATHLLGKAFGPSRSLRILNRALAECSHEEKAALHLQNVTRSCTDGTHKRQITERELKITAKEINLQYGLIDYIITQVRKRQEQSGNYR